eukprot:TRINITY_DN89_c0_g2_i4.p2 TRINITY_DN89_c0_g2~~TRINITY_DN89_c0_g2_i4.p2  ORF type:complete len:478 (+),score=133.47 TRINITY_DN89_c0_g2_i4:72-1505(+)
MPCMAVPAPVGPWDNDTIAMTEPVMPEPVMGVPIDICLAAPCPPYAPPPVQTTRGRRKTKLCKLWQENRCRRRRCPFAHGEAEIRVMIADDKQGEEKPWMKDVDEETTEVNALANFMAPNNLQRSQRMAMRDLIQHFVMENIEREATTKVTGQCAVNLDAFDTDLDLVVEGGVDAYPGEYQTRLATVLSTVGVMTCIHMRGDQPFVTFDSCQMAVVNGRWASSYFKVNITFRSGSCPERKEVSVMQMALNKYKTQRAIVPVIIALLRSSSNACAIPEKALLIMSLAFLEHSRTHPSFYNLQWVVTEFFRFYSNFDFRKHEVCVQDTPFPLKEAESDEVVIHDIMCDMNTAGGIEVECCKTSFNGIHERLVQNSVGGTRSLFHGLVSEDLIQHRNRILGEQLPEGTDPASPDQIVVQSLNSLADAIAEPCNISMKTLLQNLWAGKTTDPTEELTPTAAAIEAAARRLLALVKEDAMDC